MGLCGSGQVIRPLFFSKETWVGACTFTWSTKTLCPSSRKPLIERNKEAIQDSGTLGGGGARRRPCSPSFRRSWKTGKHVRSTDNSPQSRFGMAPAVSPFDILWFYFSGDVLKNRMFTSPPRDLDGFHAGPHLIWDGCSAQQSCYSEKSSSGLATLLSDLCGHDDEVGA